MPLRSGTAFVDLAPRLVAGFEKQVSDNIDGPVKRVAATASKVLVGALAAGGAAAVAFGLKSAKAFSDVGGEVNKLIRFTGGSAEEMSRLRFAAKQSGIETDALATGLKVLSKHLVANDKAAEGMGISYRDASGKIKPLDGLLTTLADKFSKLPNGAEKSALAVSLFGKSGTDLIPFLNKGSAGLAELTGKAAQFGAVLTQDNLDAIKKNTAAHRLWDAALEGIQVRFGAYVLPILTKFVEFATGLLMPAITTLSDLANKYLGPAFSWAFGILEKAGGQAVAFLQSEVLPKISAVASGLIDIFGPPLRFLAGLVSDYLVPAFATGFRLIGDVLVGAVAFARDVLVPGFEDAFRILGDILAPFAEKAREVFDKARDIVETRLLPALRDKLLPALQAIGDYLKDHLGPLLAGTLSAGAAAAVAGLVTQVGDLAGAAVSAFDALKLLATGPGLALVAVAALAAGLIYLYTHNEKFRETVDRVVDVIQTKLAVALEWLRQEWPVVQAAIATTIDFFETRVIPVVTKVVDFIVAKFGTVVDYFQRIWPQIEEAVGHVIETIKVIITVAINIIGVLWRAWGDDLLHVAETIFGFIKETIANTLEIIRGVIQFVLAIINGDWGKAWDALKQVVAGIWNEMWTIIGTTLDVIAETIGGVLSTIAEVWNGVWSGISDKLGGVWDSITSAVSTGIDKVVGFFTGLAGRIADAAGDVWGWLSGGLKAVIRGVAAIWNNTIGRFSFKTPSWVPGIGGKGWEMPDIDISKLAKGGDYDGLAIVGEQGIELRSGRGHIDSNRDLAAMLRDAVRSVGDAGLGRSGPALAIETAYFQDEVDVDLLFARAEFAAIAGTFG